MSNEAGAPLGGGRGGRAENERKEGDVDRPLPGLDGCTPVGTPPAKDFDETSGRALAPPLAVIGRRMDSGDGDASSVCQTRGSKGAAAGAALESPGGFNGEYRLGMMPATLNATSVGLRRGDCWRERLSFDGWSRPPEAVDVAPCSTSISALNASHSPCPSCKCCVSRVRFSGFPK